MRRPWTAIEDDCMRQFYPHLTAADMGEVLKRTVSSVFQRARIDLEAHESGSAADAQPLTCWGLSSFCAEVGHKCRAVGTCVYAPPAGVKGGA